jgi:murein DD-endopeptidase MepM/ murein hydrolase activator NlpD
MYPILIGILCLSLGLGGFLAVGAALRPRFFRENLRPIIFVSAVWFGAYTVFIVFFTGPDDLSLYPPAETSPYKLPWRAGDVHWVAQGNRSFTSHRGYHLYAWDFVMPIGTEILAAREGKVVEVVDSLDGIGLDANFVTIQHADGRSSVYAHIKHAGALVHVGDEVVQGQPIALSGMVGQAPGPHLHFYVVNEEKTSSVPVSFSDVPGGVALAGHPYASTNLERPP